MAANYGFTISVGGKSIQEMKAIEAQLQKLGVTATAQTEKIVESTERMNDSLRRVSEVIAGAFAIDRIMDFGKEILNVTAEFEGFDNRIKFSSTSLGDAAENTRFLQAEVAQLHLPIRQVYEGFSEMEAGLRGTGIEGERLRTLFQGVSTAAATLHLPADQLQRSLYDFKEIGEVGVNMRVGRSLLQQFSGIGPIVKATFGKSMNELAKEHFSGTEFLEKLGPALQKNFEPGLKQFGDSLQAAMNDTSNKFISQQIDLGERLKPVYISLMHSLVDVMAKVGQFVSFLSDHSEALNRIIELVKGLVIAFGLYQSVMYASTIATAAYEFALKAAVVAEYTFAYGIDGMIFALQELNVSLTTIGFGAIAVGIGLLIEKFASMNSELDATVEKLTHFKEITQGFANIDKQFQDFQTGFSNYKNLDPSQQSQLLTQAADIAKQSKDALAMLVNPSIQAGIQKLQGEGVNYQSYKSMNDTQRSKYYATSLNFEQKKTMDALISNEATQRMYSTRLAQANTAISMMGAMGVKTLDKTYKYPATMDPNGEAAGKTTRLSGAEGGLGQAKVVNLRIDTVMKVFTSDNKDLKRHAETAAQYVIRACNDLSESQSGTM